MLATHEDLSLVSRTCVEKLECGGMHCVPIRVFIAVLKYQKQAGRKGFLLPCSVHYWKKLEQELRAGAGHTHNLHKLNLYLKIFFYYCCVCMCICTWGMHTCQSTHVKVRGQLCGVTSYPTCMWDLGIKLRLLILILRFAGEKNFIFLNQALLHIFEVSFIKY